MSSAIGSTPGIGPATNQPRTTGESERQVGAGPVGRRGISTISTGSDGISGAFGVASLTVVCGAGAFSDATAASSSRSWGRCPPKA